MGDADVKFDVYARPFVPYALRVVNEMPAMIVPCAPVPWVDFVAYTRSFAGERFLLPDPPPPQLPAPNDKTGEAADTASRRNSASTNVTASLLAIETRLDSNNYHTYFQDALIHETAAQERECGDHVLYRVPVARVTTDPRPHMYRAPVKGLREMNIPLEIGDIVRLRQLNLSPDGNVMDPITASNLSGRFMVPPPLLQYQHDAVVWGIDRLNETLLLRIDLLYARSMMFNICFTVQSTRHLALHRSVINVQKQLLGGSNNWMRSVLFPELSNGVIQSTLNQGNTGLDWRDPMLNYEQRRAVSAALNGSSGDVPYLIFGPPGTGKTKTLVELSIQLVSTYRSTHLLVCAPSNPAADTLTRRLSEYLTPTELLRLIAPSRGFPEVPDSVLPFCYIQDNMFSLPPFDVMMRYKIVVTTCLDADMLLRARLANADLFCLERGVQSTIHPDRPETCPQLHWTGLLIDEAAQATEPEALIPLTIVAPPEEYERAQLKLPAFVMAGDRHQLGPRTASRLPELQTSLFERLLERPLYRDHPLARSKQNGGVIRPLTQTMLPIIRPPFADLIRNYRSHPAILATPSQLFYNDTLEPQAIENESMLSWPGWQGRRWPVLFVTNTGTDEIEILDQGGWYNLAEARMACVHARSFLRAGLLRPQDICIMSPFNAQVRVLRKISREVLGPLWHVNIGPLEAFQGLEASLVILCTTRTRTRFLDQDFARGLGVICEPHRFNVALTRAKDGLIVLGNPAVLELDPCWTAFMSFCHRNGLWVNEPTRNAEHTDEGPPLPGWSPPPDKAEPVYSRLEKLLTRMYNLREGSSRASNHSRLGRDVDAEFWEAGLEAEAAVMRAGLAEGRDEASTTSEDGGEEKFELEHRTWVEDLTVE